MKAIILKCLPEAKFHFGNIGLDVQSSLNNVASFIHSDTLFSAIINTASKIFPGEIEEIIGWFNIKEGEQSPEVKISSAFYMLKYNEEKEIFFLPKPVHFELLNKETKRRKLVRKIQFMSQTVWEKGINLNSKIDLEKRLIQDKFLLAEDELPEDILKEINVFQFNTRPRIADQSRKEKNNFYYQTDLCLNISTINNHVIQPHFYFLLDENFKDKNDKKKLNLIFEILAEEGIGGRRSLGYGQFSGIEERPFSLNIEYPAENFWSNISLISPMSFTQSVPTDEIESIKYYQVLTRGGRRTQDHQLKRLKMIKEGALISKKIKGNNPLINPLNSNNVYRYGQAFLLPLHKHLVI